jgi:hypothetical protein
MGPTPRLNGKWNFDDESAWKAFLLMNASTRSPCLLPRDGGLRASALFLDVNVTFLTESIPAPRPRVIIAGMVESGRHVELLVLEH